MSTITPYYNKQLAKSLLQHIDKHVTLDKIWFGPDLTEFGNWQDAKREFTHLFESGFINCPPLTKTLDGEMGAFNATLSQEGKELLHEISKSSLQKAWELFIHPSKTIIDKFGSAFIGFLVGAYGTEIVQKMNGWFQTVVGWFA